MDEQTLFSDPELDDAALARYLCGESDATERQWIEQRVHVSEVAKQELTSARMAWVASGATLLKGDIEKFLTRLRVVRARYMSQQTGEYPFGVLAESEQPVQRRESNRFKGSSWRRDGSKAHPLPRIGWQGLVGAALGAILMAAVWVGVTHQFGRRLAPAMATYATANGQRATITLPDGSTAILNVASRLEVPADYTAGNHAVRLFGEAIFTVSHHGGTPFTVLAGPTATRVLGTTFLVRRYAADTATTVAVQEGKVAIGATTLSTAQEVSVGFHGIAHVFPVEASQFSFASGVLALRRLRLSQAIPELDRWYDADIRLGDTSLASKTIDGDVTAGSLADLAEMLRVAFNVTVVRDGWVLTLYPK